jgi:hypothetical protein
MVHSILSELRVVSVEKQETLVVQEEQEEH